MQGANNEAPDERAQSDRVAHCNHVVAICRGRARSAGTAICCGRVEDPLELFQNLPGFPIKERSHLRDTRKHSIERTEINLSQFGRFDRQNINCASQFKASFFDQQLDPSHRNVWKLNRIRFSPGTELKRE